MISAQHRPTVVTVNLEHIGHNLQQVMQTLPEKTQAWAVVKANAYGHGAVEVANYLQKDVAGFCLSNIDEAIELREAGITAPLLVLGVIPIECVSLALKYQIAVTVASLEWLEAVLAMGIEVAGLSVHLKVDTGMGRIGFRDSQMVEKAIEKMSANQMTFEGIFTHFATADEKDDEQFEAQLMCFKNMLSKLSQQPKMVHASNSATAIWHQETVFDAVRLGDVLYGLNPSGQTLEMPLHIKPALTLSSSLVHVKEVAAGSTIGYGATYQTSEQEWIGTIPIGYADGLTRKMQGFKVLVDGQFCEIVGRVSMDQVTIRLPRKYPLGTAVTLIGANGEQQITVQDWANYRETINYEIVCLLSDRIARRYLKSE
ncbi:alanine racemase [Streptococcus moroccensis]|uniref:Alanine racemase n=1 Tax=Streptococcus moroccensis TaxID=1451356 RepID=A0ABT9YRZ9_9STRE|nr:alanine racemase [Streptococcus moroccensis]MDQ0222775.1 alanine racemase [Streptococcus moroccensis]